ncbi:MAG: DUF2505 domain-containing protein [Actinomycetota bacterium]
MDFEISHAFDAPPERIAEVLLDEGFQHSLSDIGALAEREVLDQKENKDGTVDRRIRCVLDIDISGAAKRFIGDGPPSWIEEASWDPDAMEWSWTIHPEVAADLLTAKGTISIAADGHAGVRIVSGLVKVSVPLYGSKVEGWILSGLESAYDDEADRLAEWLEREN